MECLIRRHLTERTNMNVHITTRQDMLDLHAYLQMKKENAEKRGTVRVELILTTEQVRALMDAVEIAGGL